MKRLLCLIGVHGPLEVSWGRTPGGSYRWCPWCSATWTGVYDGLYAGWERRRDLG